MDDIDPTLPDFLLEDFYADHSLGAKHNLASSVAAELPGAAGIELDVRDESGVEQQPNGQLR
jgi:hypothetical protein